MKQVLILFTVAAAMMLHMSAHAEFYEYIDENGVRTFTDDQSKIPPDQSGQLKRHKGRFEGLSPEEKERQLQIEREQIDTRKEKTRQVLEKFREKKERERENEIEQQKALERVKDRRTRETPVLISNNQILVPVTFTSGGTRQTAMLLLDTGANITAIVESVADSLNIDRAQKSAVKVASGAIIRTKTIEVDQIQVGPKRLQGHTVMVFKDKMASAGFQGLLGQDFLGRFMYTLDHQKKVLRWVE